jgi:hypothetical protein
MPETYPFECISPDKTYKIFMQEDNSKVNPFKLSIAWVK